MRHLKALLAAAITAVALIGPAGTASAGPIEDFCDRSPKDGKAVWYRIVCE